MPAEASADAVLPAELRGQRVARITGLRLRAWWLRNRALVAFAAACAAIGLGVWGYLEAPGKEYSVGDAAYRTLALFAVGAGADGPDTQVDVARWIAPLVVGWTAIVVLFALFQQQSQLLRVRFGARRHVIVAGLGRRGLLLVERLHAARVSVVVVERDDRHPGLPSLRQRGVPVVQGDARDPEILLRARADRALHLVCCCDTDATNLEVLAAAARLADHPGWLPATVHVLLETPELRTRLEVRSFFAPDRRRLRADFASLDELSAKALVGAAGGGWALTGDPVTIVALAGTRTTRLACAQAVRRARADAERVRLVLVGAGAARDGEALRRDAPWVFDAAEVTTLPWDLTHEPAVPAELPPEAGLALVGDPDDALALAAAAVLAQHVRCRAGVVVDVAEDLPAGTLETAGLGLPGVIPVAAARRVLGPDLLLDTAGEAVARARHEAYVRAELAAGHTPAGNPSLVSWDELPETLKESNRRYADAIGRAVLELGGRLVPLDPLAPPPEVDLEPDVVERLARAEHERWTRDLRDDGWQPTTGAKDPVLRRHPQLVPWEQLDEDERRKDREAVRTLPAVLAVAGYRLEPADGAPRPVPVGAA